MDRRKSLKALAVGTISTGVLIDACKTETKKGAESPKEVQAEEPGINRMAEEKAHEDEIKAMPKFFTDAEMATITALGDIIIPKDDISGSASDAKVSEFIEFIVKDMPEHQVPMRGGLRWLDLQCINRYGKAFTDCTQQQQLEMVNDIAYPEINYTDENGKQVKKGNVKPNMQPGVSFFSLMRDLTATGFYTSEIGLKDVGYMGNVPNKWNGVPDDVLKQYGYAYTEKEMKECASY
jgi:gluconate 2-dehydrogenase gamma chain